MKRKIIILVTIFVLLTGGVVGYFLINNKDKEANNKAKLDDKPVVVDSKLKIVDPNSKSRPYAVMINNLGVARPYHSGLQDAYIIYEMIVEGGITRLMAVFKDTDTGAIGSVRSARHYYLDYAMENDAYYTHWGWSTLAESDISSLRINNINGLAYEGIYFYRNKDINVDREHTGFTNMELLKKATAKLKYRTETNKDLLLNYTTDKVDLSLIAESKIANNITIEYSKSLTNKYVYDSANENYQRFVNGKAHIDYVTKKQYTFKNIITYQIANSSYNGTVLQVLDNIGSGTGYYFTNGYAAPIKWSKASRSEQTIYTYMDGTKIDVSDGNTFIQIQPKNKLLTITE